MEPKIKREGRSERDTKTDQLCRMLGNADKFVQGHRSKVQAKGLWRGKSAGGVPKGRGSSSPVNSPPLLLALTPLDSTNSDSGTTTTQRNGRPHGVHVVVCGAFDLFDSEPAAPTFARSSNSGRD